MSPFSEIICQIIAAKQAIASARAVVADSLDERRLGFPGDGAWATINIKDDPDEPLDDRITMAIYHRKGEGNVPKGDFNLADMVALRDFLNYHIPKPSGIG